MPEGQNPKVRANGEGSIYKLESRGVWRASYRIPFIVETEDGPMRAWKSIVGTSASRSEAIARRQAALERWQSGGRAPVWRGGRVLLAAPAEPTPLPTLTISELMDRWLLWKQANPEAVKAISVSVAHMYSRLIELHVKPHLGELDAATITRKELVDHLLITLPSKTNADGSPLLGPAPKRQVQLILGAAFRWAKEEELIENNPAVRLPSFERPTKKGEQLERKAWIVKRILAKIQGTEEEAYWILAFAAALRQSERLGIEWSCFTNLDGKDKTRPMRLEIRQQLWRDPKTGKLSIKRSTKSAAGTRIIPLDDRVAAVIRAHKKRQDLQRQSPDWDPIPGMEDLVYLTDKGKPRLHQLDNKAWRALFDRCINPNHLPGSEKYVEPLRGHALRHLAISGMVSNGVSIEIIAALAGHGADSTSITRNVYTHLSWTTGIEAIGGLTSKLYEEADRKADRTG